MPRGVLMWFSPLANFGDLAREVGPSSATGRYFGRGEGRRRASPEFVSLAISGIAKRLFVRSACGGRRDRRAWSVCREALLWWRMLFQYQQLLCFSVIMASVSRLLSTGRLFHPLLIISYICTRLRIQELSSTNTFLALRRSITHNTLIERPFLSTCYITDT